MYAKIFSQIYDGTLCTNGPWEALVTFQQLLILADQDGSVDMTLPAISRRTTIPMDILERGIASLLAPDPHSRTPTAEGRRILPLCDGRAWGWKVTNYEQYRQLKREEDRREYHRAYWRKRSAAQSTDPQQTQHDSTPLNTTQQTQPNQPIAEAYAEAEAVKAPRKRSAAPSVPEWLDADAWAGFVEMRRKLKKPMSDRAMNLMFAKLQDFKDGGADVVDLLNRSVMNSWLDVYPAKDSGGLRGNTGAAPGADMFAKML